MCVDRHKWRVLVSRLSHTHTLPGRRGFLLRPVARLPRPRVLSTTRKSATLCPYPLRVLLIGRGFIAPPGDLRCQNSRASSGKAYDLPACRPASHRFDTAGYRVSLAQACLTLSPMPYSRFAVRYVRRFYLMLPPDPSSLTAPLPCWCRPSVRSRWAVLLPVDIHQKVGQYAMPSTLADPRAHDVPEGAVHEAFTVSGPAQAVEGLPAEPCGDGEGPGRAQGRRGRPAHLLGSQERFTKVLTGKG